MPRPANPGGVVLCKGEAELVPRRLIRTGPDMVAADHAGVAATLGKRFYMLRGYILMEEFDFGT